MPDPIPTLLSVKQFAQAQPALSEGAIRWHLFHSKANGLEGSGALVRVGHRVLIDPARYVEWLRSGPTICPVPRPKAAPVLEVGQ